MLEAHLSDHSGGLPAAGNDTESLALAVGLLLPVTTFLHLKGVFEMLAKHCPRLAVS